MQQGILEAAKEAVIDNLGVRFEVVPQSIAETNKRIDSVRDELVIMITETNKRIDETNKRIDSVRDELVGMITQINKRIDGLHGVIVRMDQHMGLQTKVEDLAIASEFGCAGRCHKPGHHHRIDLVPITGPQLPWP